MTTTPFHNLEDYVSLPRVEALSLSPDGRRAVLTVATLSADRTTYERALWAVPTDGEGNPVRLTRSAKGESGATHLPSGDVLFVSGRPGAGEDDTQQVWMLPAAGGEARPITALGGAGDVVAAGASAAAVFTAPIMPSAQSIDDDARIRAARTKRKVKAIVHASAPVRFWDHDLGPALPHLIALNLTDVADTISPATEPDPDNPVYPASLPRPRDLTPDEASQARIQGVAMSPDGSTVVASLPVAEGARPRWRLVSIDVAGGGSAAIVDEPGCDITDPVFSHDGSALAYTRAAQSTPDAPAHHEVWVAAPDGSNARRIAADWDRWTASVSFSAGDDALIVTADDNGRAPIFRIPLDGAAVTRITNDDFAYSDVNVDLATGDLVALRSSWIESPHPVRVARDGTVTVLATPAPPAEVPGTLTEVAATASDGTPVRGWLLLPEGASADAPAPLLLWIHGGPLGSWNAWSWRWSPALAAARGYAVLLPDPALSTGYGLDFIARGWNSWGGAPYTDLMAITDAVVARPDIDGDRTAAMGGSFGGYMANWIAGHTDRFRAIVTHASLWALDQFSGTTDSTWYWRSIFSPEGMVANSPHLHVDAISTPMLVVHGDRDYRVPIGEGLRLWSELTERFSAPDGTTAHRFLYFPNENHWILTPQHAIVWYETVLGFMDAHVLGEQKPLPEALG